MKAKTWYLYMLRCGNGNLYTGITTDVKRRFTEHQESGKACAKCLRGKGPLRLLVKKRIGTRNQALRMEYRVKKVSREIKLRLIAGTVKFSELK
jgi:putative endonuclease